MSKESSDRTMLKILHPRVLIAVGTAILVGLVALTITLSMNLPPQSRACSLMPGFCLKKSDDTPRGPLEELGRIRPGETKFGLSSSLAHRY